MASSVEHGKVILAAILAGRGQQNTAVLDYAVARLLPADRYFTDHAQVVLFELCRRYADAYRAILPRKALDDVLREQPPGTALQYGEYYDALCTLVPQADEFRHSVDQLRELTAERETGNALAQGMEILRSGAHSDDGKAFLRGHAAARAHVLSALAAVEQAQGSSAETPEGDVRAERQQIMARYADAKEARIQGTSPGIQFGVPALDARLKSGVMPGSLALVLGWTSAGKTSQCVQWSWHVATVQKLDVVYFTTETLRPQVIAKFVARHSRSPQFGLQNGLNCDDILGGMLSPAEEEVLGKVTADLASGPYGRFHVVQCGRAASVAAIEARLTAIRRQFRPRFVVMDYAQLLAPERSFRDSRVNADLAGIVKGLKQVAAAFDGGSGVALVTPWQVSREGRRNLKASGGYSLLDVAETKEAADIADLVLALVDPEKDSSSGHAVPIEVTVLKNRAGERGFKAELLADFRSSYFGPRNVSPSGDILGMGG